MLFSITNEMHCLKENLRDLLEVLTVDTSVATLIAIVRKVAAALAAAHKKILMDQSIYFGFSER